MERRHVDAISASVADKQALHSAFQGQAPFEVEAPELGEGVVVRFKAELSVEDVLAVAAVETWQRELVLPIILFQRMAVDSEGKPLVEETGPKWFIEGASGVLISRLARRARLVERFAMLFKASPGDGEPLTQDGLTRVVQDVAVAMKLSPASIRAWAAQDLLGVLETYARSKEERE